MTVSWPSGVPDRFERDGYTRTMEDVVRRYDGDSGPPSRRLRWATAGQTLTGQIPMSASHHATFEAWRQTELDNGKASFDLVLRDHGTPRTVEAQFTAQPRLIRAGSVIRRVALELRLAPPAPSGAALAALAALDRASAAAWPSGVPGTPKRASFSSEADSQVIRGNPEGPMSGRLMSRQEGRIEPVTLTMTGAELAAFELWFATTAAFGARDVLFPAASGARLGCFAGSYTVTAPATQSGFTVSFERYIEAVQ